MTTNTSYFVRVMLHHINAIVSLIALLPCISVFAESDSQVAKNIFDAARKQQTEVNSALFKIKVRETINSRRPESPSAKKETTRTSDFGKRLQANKPEKNLSAEFHVQISFLGVEGCSRVENHQPQVDKTGTKLLPTTRIAAFDGQKQSRSLVNREQVPVPKMGFVLPSSAGNQDIATVSYRPLIIAFRPFDKQFIGDFTLEQYTEVKDRRDGLIHLGSGRRELSFDPKMNNALRRFAIMSDPKTPYATVEVTRVDTSGFFWVPIQWNVTYFGFAGDATSYSEYEVVDYKLNPPLARADFLLEFNPGTLVVKRLDQSAPTQNDEYWYVGANQESDEPVERAV